MNKSTFLCSTDCFLENEQGEILMINRNKNKKILPDFYNGIGGHLENGETPSEAMQREIQEEAGADNVKQLTLKGILTIKDKFGAWQIFIFTGHLKREKIKNMSIPEGRLEWIAKEQLKNKKLVPDLFPWIDLLWKDNIKFFFAKVKYDDTYKLIEDVKIEIINN